jgi:hypothetical protein
MVSFLIKKGSNLENTNNFGETALYLCFKTLIDGNYFGDDISDEYDYYDYTLFGESSFYDKFGECIDDDKGMIIPEYIINTKEIMNFLIDNSAKMDIVDYKGNTLLMESCYSFKHGIYDDGEKFFKVLEKVDINKQNDSGDTALHIATYHQDFLKIKKLLEYGANVNIKNKAGLTPLGLLLFNELYNIRCYISCDLFDIFYEFLKYGGDQEHINIFGKDIKDILHENRYPFY